MGLKRYKTAKKPGDPTYSSQWSGVVSSDAEIAKGYKCRKCEGVVLREGDSPYCPYCDDYVQITKGQAVKRNPNSKKFKFGDRVETTQGVWRSGKVIKPLVSVKEATDGSYREPTGGEWPHVVYVKWDDGTKGWTFDNQLADYGDPKLDKVRNRSRLKADNNPPAKATVEVSKVLSALGLPENADDLIERNQEYIYEMSKPDPDTEYESDDARVEVMFKNEKAVIDSIVKAWKNAIESTLEYLTDKTGIEFVINWKTWRCGIACADWDDCGRQIVHIINGVGMFEFSGLREAMESIPTKSARQFVLTHWHHARYYPEVYESKNLNHIFQWHLDNNLRHL